MRILITGAGGFLGGHLLPLLKAAGHDCLLFGGDVRDKRALAGLKGEKIEAVIHLAAKINSRNRRLLFEINSTGTENLLAICREFKPRVFIFLSTIRVLSARPTAYALSKKAAEEAVKKSGWPYAILRPSLLYGPGDRKNLAVFFSLIRRWPLMPILDFKIQPLYAGDLAKIICRSLEARDNPILNLTGGETVALSELSRRAAKLLNRRCHIWRLPRFLAYFMKWLPFLPVPREQLQALLANEIFPSDPWPEIFKIKPTELNQGLRQTLK